MTPFSSFKILKHLPVLHAHYVEGKAHPPILVEIDLTNRCASACPWCAGYLNRPQSKADLFEGSFGHVCKLLDELKSLGCKAVTWTGGGDPTQSKNLLGVILHAYKLGLEQGLITHGVIGVAHLLKYLLWVRFSVDAATREGYARQHGKPEHWEKVLNNVSHAASIARECTVGVGFVTHADSYAEIVPFAKLWAGIPVDYIQYRPLHDTHGSTWLSDAENIAEVVSLIQTAREVDSRVVFSEPKYQAMLHHDSGRTRHCHGTHFEVAISADTCVYTCCHLKGDPRYKIGDLQQESFSSIWYRHIASKVMMTDDCPSFCRHYSTNKLLESISDVNYHQNFI